MLTLENKKKLLESCHPDYRSGIKAEIPIGVNRGKLASRELIEMLASESMLDLSSVDLNNVHHNVDVLVIGGGGGGATAALFAKEAGAKVMIVTKLRFGDSNTIMAEGGINACTSTGDSPSRHFIDTMGGGGFVNTPAMVRSLVEDSPLIIQWLEKLGVPFYKNKDGNFIKRHIAGGHTRPRGHAVGDYTGMSIMQILRDEVLNQQIEVIEHCPAIELVMDENGRSAGAICMNIETRQLILIKAKTVILATGGLGRIHVQGFPTTNHYGATADGIVMAYRAGVELLYIDSIQFHPTGTCFPAQVIGLLVSETSRAKGAQLVNVNGERFINELETRDAVASAIIREASDRGNGIETPLGNHGIWLDTPVIDIRN
ncbi:MAG: FAD-binding protein, partial [Planctomycetota bacterium]